MLDQPRTTLRPVKTNWQSQPSNCPVCEQLIREPSEDGKDLGDEALYCEGTCETWYHRRCVGISKHAYNIASESDNPFIVDCFVCNFTTIMLSWN